MSPLYGRMDSGPTIRSIMAHPESWQRQALLCDAGRQVRCGSLQHTSSRFREPWLYQRARAVSSPAQCVIRDVRRCHRQQNCTAHNMCATGGRYQPSDRADIHQRRVRYADCVPARWFPPLSDTLGKVTAHVATLLPEIALVGLVLRSYGGGMLLATHHYSWSVPSRFADWNPAAPEGDASHSM
jgi:hypothetical protein